MSNSRIPLTLHEFNDYIYRVQKYLNTIRLPDALKRGLMLGLSAPQVASIVTLYGQWYTGNPASPGLWELHTNAYGVTKTKLTRQQVVDFMKNFAHVLEPMLNLMAASAILDDTDRALLNIKAIDTVRTFHPVPDDRGPLGSVNSNMPLAQMLRLVDPSNPDTREQPAGVVATRIYQAIKDQGATPADADFHLAGDTSTFEFLAHYDSTYKGKVAHSYGVWIDSKRTEGIRGNTFSATIV